MARTSYAPYSEDMADACVELPRIDGARFNAPVGTYPHLVNIGCGSDPTIHELAELVARTVGFRGALQIDVSKPDGTPGKRLGVSRMMRSGWSGRMGMREGIAPAYREFLGRSEVRATA